MTKKSNFFTDAWDALSNMTLIELMIIVAIFGIVLAVAIPIFYNSCDYFEVGKCYTRIDSDPFKSDSDTICIIEKKDGYIKFKHTVYKESTVKSDRCQMYRNTYKKSSE